MNNLPKIEEDMLSETYKISINENIPLRIILPSKESKSLMEILGSSEMLTIASMHKNGFAVHFDIVK